VSFETSGSGLKISWSEEYDGFQLEATTDLGLEFGPPPDLNPVEGETNTFTVPITGEALFLRLKKL
jgi:hypothetical protein